MKFKKITENVCLFNQAFYAINFSWR